MNIHEFGKENEQKIVLIHPSLVMWDYFEYLIPQMEKKYHLIIPALPGYDPDVKNDFTGIEEIAGELEGWLSGQGIDRIACIYGCSMGGSVVMRFLADGKIQADSAVMDGGITPYQLPRIATRFIALKDYLTIGIGKVGGIKVLERAFSTDEYSREDLEYVEGVLKMISSKTIWRTFDSCNNYRMPDPVVISCPRVEYWYADAEKKARKADIEYVKKNIPQVSFREFANIGHAGLAALHPELLASSLEALINPV